MFKSKGRSKKRFMDCLKVDQAQKGGDYHDDNAYYEKTRVASTQNKPGQGQELMICVIPQDMAHRRSNYVTHNKIRCLIYLAEQTNYNT